MSEEKKPIHVKPSLYAYYFEPLKEIARKYGYNLVLHGSLNRDLDLIAVPWMAALGDYKDMVFEFAQYLYGNVRTYTKTHHGRILVTIDLNRGEFSHHKWYAGVETDKDGNYISENKRLKHKDGEPYPEDPQYYVDISIIPHNNEK